MILSSPLLGCAVADALGKPFETKSASHIVSLNWDGRSYRPGDYPNLPKPYQDTGELLNRPGVPTDDTQMSRILARWMWDKKSPAMPDAYVEWLGGKSFVGVPRGMGGTIRRSLEAFSHGSKPKEVASDSPCGTGAAMRSGVLGMLGDGVGEVIAFAATDSEFTHPGHLEARASAAAMALAVHFAKDNKFPLSSLPRFVAYTLASNGYQHSATVHALRLASTGLSEPVPDDWFPGDAVGITASAILCAGLATNYLGGVVRAIRMGGDTDTRGAMTGTILGARYGMSGDKGIPGHLIQDLYESTEIKIEDQKLVALTASRA